MKYRPILASLLATTLAFTATAQAGLAPTSGMVGNIKLALTLKSTVDGTFERDEDGKFIKDEETNQRIPTDVNEWTVTRGKKTVESSEEVTKILTTRYGNRELLEDFLADGLIPDTSIRGWSLKAVTRQDMGAAYFVEKKGEEPVDVTNRIMFETTELGLIAAQAVNSLETVTRTEGVEEPVLKVKRVEAMNGFFAFGLQPTEDAELFAFGAATITGKTVLTKNKEAVVIGKVSMPHLAGHFQNEDGGFFAEGSFGVSGGVATDDLTRYFPEELR